MHLKGVPLPLVHEAAARAKTKNKAEDTFEGQGTTIEKLIQEVNDVYQMPEMVQIPGMCSQEGADNIKKLAEKKRGHKEDNDQVVKESEQEQKPNDNQSTEPIQ